MAKKENKPPTNGELEILRKLWDRGPSTVREIFRDLNEERPTGYTTVLKLMQNMTDKGLLSCDKSVRPQVYHVVRSKTQTQRQLLSELVDKVFSGSPGNLVLQALSSRKATPDERRKIRELLDKLEKKSK